MSSFLIGHVRTTYAKLVDKFGQPKWGPDDKEGNKVSCERELSFHDDAGQEHEFRIYDWKECGTPRGEYAWHIGGKDGSHMEAIRKVVPALAPGEGRGAFVLAKQANGYAKLKICQDAVVVREVCLGEALRTMTMYELFQVMQAYGSIMDVDTECDWTAEGKWLVNHVFAGAWAAAPGWSGPGRCIPGQAQYCDRG